jgi:Molybdopterin converting factor, large subunit
MSAAGDTNIDVQIREKPLEADFCESFVMDSGAGGHVVFIGTVRNQTGGKPVQRLEFESYAPMAIKEMVKISKTILQRWDVLKISLHHRVGSLAISDTAVIIAVSAPHRGAAFEACQYAIDTLKETVPIWKKEVFDDGQVWVAAHP